jgi:hypothetical protein
MSVPMFRDYAKRGVQTDALAPGGNHIDNDAALADYIDQGTRWVDDQLGLVGQSLATAYVTDTGHSRLDRGGYLEFIPRVKPLIGIVGASFGPPGALTALTTLQGTSVQPQSALIPVSPLAGTSWSGPLQFGNPPVGREIWWSVTYMPGFPVTTLTADAAVGATQISVADVTGILPGITQLKIYAGRGQFRFIPTAVSAATGPGTIGCPALPRELKNDIRYPIMVSALPQTIISATALATRGFIKAPGGGNISANTRQKTSDPGAADDFEQAWKQIRDYAVLNA